MGNEVAFLPADKQKSFLQVGSITLGMQSQACPKITSTQSDKFAVSFQYLKENVKDEVVFLPADKY